MQEESIIPLWGLYEVYHHCMSDIISFSLLLRSSLGSKYLGDHQRTGLWEPLIEMTPHTSRLPHSHMQDQIMEKKCKEGRWVEEGEL